MAKEPWERDAEEFGRRIAFGEWDSALRVARSVYTDPKIMGRHTAPRSRERGRATTEEFSEAAGVSRTTVVRYFKTWNAAAKDGLVPPAEDLMPGGAYGGQLPGADEWDTYYRRANPLKTSKTVSQEKDADVAALGALADAGRDLDTAVEAFGFAKLSDRQRASAEVMCRGIEERIAAIRQITQPDDLDAELAALTEGGV